MTEDTTPARKASYEAAHLAVKRARGIARDYWCDSCDERAAEWAYLHTPPCPNEQVDQEGRSYSFNVERYVPMCKRCHRTYDKPSTCKHGHPWTDVTTFWETSRHTGHPIRRCRICIDAKDRQQGVLRKNRRDKCVICGSEIRRDCMKRHTDTHVQREAS